MAHVALDFPVSGGARPHARTFRRFHALLRHWRRTSGRRHLIAQLRAETSDPRIFEDVGFPPPVRGVMETVALAILFHEH